MSANSKNANKCCSCLEQILKKVRNVGKGVKHQFRRTTEESWKQMCSNVTLVATGCNANDELYMNTWCPDSPSPRVNGCQRCQCLCTFAGVAAGCAMPVDIEQSLRAGWRIPAGLGDAGSCQDWEKSILKGAVAATAKALGPRWLMIVLGGSWYPTSRRYWRWSSMIGIPIRQQVFEHCSSVCCGILWWCFGGSVHDDWIPLNPIESLKSVESSITEVHGATPGQPGELQQFPLRNQSQRFHNLYFQTSQGVLESEVATSPFGWCLFRKVVAIITNYSFYFFYGNGDWIVTVHVIMRMKCLSTSMIGWVQWNSTMGFIWLGLKIGCTNPLVDHNFLMKWPSTVVPYFQTRPATKLAGLHLCSRPTRFTSNGFSTQEAHTVAARHWEWDSEDAVWCYRCCFCFVAPWSCEMILGVKALTPGIYYTYCYSIYYIYIYIINLSFTIYIYTWHYDIYIYYQSIFHNIYIHMTLWYIYIYILSIYLSLYIYMYTQHYDIYMYVCMYIYIYVSMIYGISSIPGLYRLDFRSLIGHQGVLGDSGHRKVTWQTRRAHRGAGGWNCLLVK